jgi:hypothetical protein
MLSSQLPRHTSLLDQMSPQDPIFKRAQNTRPLNVTHQVSHPYKLK